MSSSNKKKQHQWNVKGEDQKYIFICFYVVELLFWLQKIITIDLTQEEATDTAEAAGQTAVASETAEAAETASYTIDTYYPRNKVIFVLKSMHLITVFLLCRCSKSLLMVRKQKCTDQVCHSLKTLSKMLRYVFN